MTSYSSEAEKAWRESLERLIEKNVRIGANAVVHACMHDKRHEGAKTFDLSARRQRQ